MLGTDEDVIYYNSERRAQHGIATGYNNDNWIYLEDIADKTMYPGVFYSMYFAAGHHTIRFVAKKENGRVKPWMRMPPRHPPTAAGTVLPIPHSTIPTWQQAKAIRSP